MIEYECPYCSMQLKKMEERCPYCGAPGKEFKEIFDSESQPITPQGNYKRLEMPQKDIPPQGKNKSVTAMVCLICGFLSIGSFFGFFFHGCVFFAIVSVVTFIVTITDKEAPKQKKTSAKVGFGLSMASLLFIGLILLVFLLSTR